MTKTLRPFSDAEQQLRQSAALFGSLGANPDPQTITAAQDAIHDALGALEEAAFTYHPTEHREPGTGNRLFRQETVNAPAAAAYRHLQAFVKPLIDPEQPTPEDLRRLTPLLAHFIAVHYPSELADEQQ